MISSTERPHEVKQAAWVWLAVMALITAAALILWISATHIANRPAINVGTPGASVHINDGGISVTTAPSRDDSQP